jgi:hypothetical protein
VLELARRGIGADVVALDPGGFWNRPELSRFTATLWPFSHWDSPRAAAEVLLAGTGG